MTKEIWKDIKGYKGHYQISNNGRVKSLYRIAKKHNGIKRQLKKKFIKCPVSSSGYRTLKLYKNGERKLFLLHRVLAIHFIKNKGNRPYINHINGIRTDNRIRNLEWVSGRENSLHHFKRYKRKSSYSYVYWVEKLKRYKASIRINGKDVCIGSFFKNDKTAYEAIKLFCRKNGIKNKYL